MADTSAYRQKLMDKEGNDVYPITTADAVFVQTSSGGTYSQKTLATKLSEMESSFQAGCNTLVNKLKSLGVTPASSSPSDIAAAMDTLKNNYYNAGVSAADSRVNTSSASYSRGVSDADGRVNGNSASYTAGRSQGQADVKANPGGYGLITQTDYNNYGSACYNNGVAAGKAAVNGSVSCSVGFNCSKEDVYNANGYNSGSATATASISNGKLSVSISGSLGLKVVAWLGGSPYETGEASQGLGSNNSKQIA